MDVKKQLRLKFRQWMKENVTLEYSLTFGKEICKTIQQELKEFTKSQKTPVVSIFISKFPEISTAPLIDYLYSIDVNVYIPAWHSEEMWMCHVKNRGEFEKILRDAPVNKIPMPEDNRVPIESVVYDFIIIPGLVFDLNCHRLGYGYGHYDYFLSRYFAAHPESQTKLIGVAYDEQILKDSLPFEEHDIQLHQIITQSRKITRSP